MPGKHSFKTFIEILLVSSRLGFTSFGGPVAHLSYFKDEYVDRKKWLDDKMYADIIALCQFLPGPASSQVGIAIGMMRGGILGGFLCWFGFTMPSILILVIFAMLYQTFSLGDGTFIHSLKIVAAAVVLHAIIGLGKKLTPDRTRIAIALAAALIMLLYPSAWMQLLIIVGAGLLGLRLFNDKTESNLKPFPVSLSKKVGVCALILLVTLLIALPILNSFTDNALLHLFDMFFRVGALVFGGGHVVLPMIERQIVPQGLLSADQFLAGYGMAQAVPGPLFTFASYLGTMLEGITGAIVVTVAIFLPSFLLITAALPFLNELRKRASFQKILIGVNASVVGILLAAFYDPVFKSAIIKGEDFALAAILFALLSIWKLPAWMIVLIGVIGGYVIQLIS
ncbi:chromate efflux transporter [Alkalihalobacillus hwajinpoensis]|uniref:chromate efflux transporter n=1 Tax=Guptibacillus hwajinpoensis TaxID=208199 RepID=UPI0018841F40|nr:chromate efflux transporter [Pseudalkalibacillus hwajinpoensis]MBF0707326.1 chromate efflux transporter [Pseudalkalibacillus hwajinpoensis]